MTPRDTFEREATAIYRVAFRHLGNREEAEDVTRRVFLDDARRGDSKVDEATRQRRLFDAVHHAIVDKWSGRGASSSMRPGWHVADPAMPTESSDQAERAMLTRVLQRLAPMERRVLELRLLQGRSLAETGEELGIGELPTKALQQTALRRAVEVARQDWGAQLAEPKILLKA
jgi:RNA polymerase sigma-70 factor (ECF subfamily)